MALITITADLPSGATTQLTADQVSAHFALAPQLLIFDTGEVAYAEHSPFLLIHIPGGRPVTDTRAGVDLRRLAVLLEELPVDWNQVDPSEAAHAHIDQIRAALAAATDETELAITLTA